MKSLRTRHGLILFVALALLALTPLFLVAIPPMVDYPNHMARCSILGQLSTNPELAKLYEPGSFMLPNMAMDAIVVPLAKFMPILVAGRVFCGLVLLSLFSGALTLSLALFKKITFWSFAPALLLFNHIYAFGFLNYLFGIGLMLWSLAAWIRLRDRKLWLRLLVISLLAVLMYFSHLMALFLFGCAALGWEFARWLEQPNRRFRDLALDTLVLASAFVVPYGLLKLTPTQSELSRYIADKPIAKYNDVVQILRTDPSFLDAAFSYTVFAAMAFLFITGCLKIEKRMRWPIVLVFLAFLALPTNFATSGCVDMRVPIVAAFMLVSGTAVITWNRFSQIGLGVLGLAFIVRTGQVTNGWLAGETEQQTVLADFQTLPDHSVVFTGADGHVALYSEATWNPPIIHLPLLIAGSRPVFFPQIFAIPAQHPLVMRPELLELERFQGLDPTYFRGGSAVSLVIEDCRAALANPSLLPPSLGPRPGLYIYLLTTKGEKLEDLGSAQLVFQRDRYALLKLTSLEEIYAHRERYWRQVQSLRSGSTR